MGTVRQLDEHWVKRIDAVAAVLEAIQEEIKEAKKKGHDIADGTVECPLCGQRFHYQVSPRNGHIRGSCYTENCISFMQ